MSYKQFLTALAIFAFVPLSIYAQDDEEEIFELSPFEVQRSKGRGYRANSTLAGTRIDTNLKDVGSAISVITDEFLQDIGATDNRTLLAYTTNIETGGGSTNSSQ